MAQLLKSPSGVSVVICCYNAAERLPDTLRHLSLQVVPQTVKWEIIVVDNASTDGTAEIAAAAWDGLRALPISFRIVTQETPGLSHAREKGIAAARYNYLLFCDDDNWLFPDYVARCFEIMESDPAIGALGGCGLFEPEEPCNQEIVAFKTQFVTGPQTWAEREHWVYGAGSVYRKDILDALHNAGWSQITTGRKGKQLSCGEDVEICFMLYLLGYKIKAEDMLRFRHFVPLKRQQFSYLLSTVFWSGYAHVLLNSYYTLLSSDPKPINRMLDGWMVSATKNWLKNVASLLYRRAIKGEKITFEQEKALQSNYGIFRSLLINRRRVAQHHRHVREVLHLMKGIPAKPFRT